MSQKAPKISLVIPVYNEEDHLADCLTAVCAQQVPFSEIIVIDNNSTDDTAAIASLFPGITLLHESKQGVIHARTAGFNHASGDIIARIDADTLLPTDWTRQLMTIFSDQSIAAVSGKVTYYDMAAGKLFNYVDLFFRRYFAKVLGREVALQAANMAIRKTVWRTIKHDICKVGGMHEDFDLAIHTNWAGHTVKFDERLVAGIGYRQAEAGFKDFCTYACLSPKTYRSHGLRSARYMYPVVGLAIICYGVLKLLHRGYDPEAHKFSVVRAFTVNSAIRVNPATFVD